MGIIEAPGCCLGPCVFGMQARKVTSDKKLKVIKAVLNVDYEPEQESEGSQHGATHHRQHSETFDEVRVCVCVQLSWV